MTRRLLQEHDRILMDVFGSLTDEDWAHPSLCDGWTNHDVLAHLVIGCRFPAGQLAATMVRDRCSFDGANDTMARDLAAATPAAGLLHELAGHLARLPARTRLLFPARLMLGDHLTHYLDVALPLHRDPAILPAAGRAILQTEVSVPNPFVPARRHASGLRIEATDIDWHHGPPDAPLVRGSAAHLVSVLAGRPFALPRLHGPGVRVLRDRVGPPTRTRRALPPSRSAGHHPEPGDHTHAASGNCRPPYQRVGVARCARGTTVCLAAAAAEKVVIHPGDTRLIAVTISHRVIVVRREPAIALYSQTLRDQETGALARPARQGWPDQQPVADIGNRSRQSRR